MQHLVEDHSSVDPTFVEDFLLTYRTFLPTPGDLTQKLMKWFEDPTLRAKVKLMLAASNENVFTIFIWLKD